MISACATSPDDGRAGRGAGRLKEPSPGRPPLAGFDPSTIGRFSVTAPGRFNRDRGASVASLRKRAASFRNSDRDDLGIATALPRNPYV
jgi:hypothetical protein